MLAGLSAEGLLATLPEGFMLLSLAADEAEVLTLAVAPDSRRHGRGAALLAAATEAAAARGAMTIHLEVAKDNEAARALYAKAGFREVGHRRGYYERPTGRVDALRLARDLAGRSPGRS